MTAHVEILLIPESVDIVVSADAASAGAPVVASSDVIDAALCADSNNGIASQDSGSFPKRFLLDRP